ncbi:hypothetical protein [Photobacterium atrarenae]|uniref:Small CPxCG-related zinc finger protein n=1 Tax=Photobacterium atrarenae TaxID=865757 RepID=A0ABY5GB65_9GAMM|nr:hypothetical protein [Photobacterium atrarenae]UTV26420.1 hypothetical protein NNL38_08495 [Photobacterium atrarenae]
MSKTLHPTWLTCEKCDSSRIEVTTERGNDEWLYSGDPAKCLDCSATGIIEADGDAAWFEVDEENDDV